MSEFPRCKTLIVQIKKLSKNYQTSKQLKKS